MKKFFTIALLLIIANSVAWAKEPLTWAKLFEMIDDRFPNLPEKTITDLVQLQKNRVPFHLFDVRKKEEFQVSHIQNALNITTSTKISKKVPKKDALIIAYCSVGYRSAAVVADLRSKGYTNSFNLKGSIFQWANSGYKVYRNGTETAKVHPFNQKWGVLLEKKYHYEKKSSWWGF